MLSRLIRMRWPIPVIAVVVVLLIVGVAVVAGSDEDALVIYNGRSHYGDEQVFLDFEEETGIDIELRGGTGLHVLKLGDVAEGFNRWAMTNGSDQIYTISSWSAEWATANVGKFQLADKPAEGTTAHADDHP